ncbi:hypothetical protein D0Y65_005982 [Glycine soja]|nr:hypothetical protein D0Y65_005982 [Glycine soja]
MVTTTTHTQVWTLSYAVSFLMSDEINLILHHNAKFIQNANEALEYVDGEFYVWEEVEKDLVNVWTPQELCKAYCNYVKLLTL